MWLLDELRLDGDPTQRWLNIAATIAALYAGKELAVWGYRRWTAKGSKLSPPPCPPGAHPVLQHISVLTNTMKNHDLKHFDAALDVLMQKSPELGEVFMLNLVALQMVCVCNPDAAREVIMVHNWKKSPTYRPLDPIMGKGNLVSLSDEPAWARHRKAFNPGFTPQFLREAAVPVFVRKTQELINNRLAAAAKAGSIVKLHTEAVLLTLDIICAVALSKNYGFMSSEEPPVMYHHFFKLLDDIVYYEERPHLLWMQCLPWEWLRLWRNQRQYDLCTLRDIEQRIAEAAAAPQAASQHNDILGLAIKMAQEEQQPLSAADALSQVKAFLFAGHDTTASTMAFAIYEVSRNPHIQAKLLEEVDRVCGRAELPTAAHLPQLHYLSAVVKETLRMWPPASTARIAPKGATLQGYDVGGKVIYVSHVHIHRSTKYWGPDAAEFKPERWLQDHTTGSLHPCVYMPFSKGLRDCIGQNFANMEMRVVLAMLYQRFTFEYAHPQPEERGYHVTAYPFHHVPVKVHERT